MPRFPARVALAVSALLASGLASAQPGVLDVTGTTSGVPTAALPLFGSTPGACVLAGTPEPYDPTDFATDTAGSHALDVAEPVQMIPDTDDTVLLVYDGAFDPANACDDFLGVGPEAVGSGLTLDLAAGDYVLVVAGFLGTEDPYTVRITGPEGSTLTSERVVALGDDAEDVRFSLGAAYPNPATSEVTVPYALAEAGPARLAVLDALGREVVVLADGHAEAGAHEARFDGSLLPTGAYLVRLTTEADARTRALTVTR